MNLHQWTAAAAQVHLGSPAVLRGQVEIGSPVEREHMGGHLEGTAGFRGLGGSFEESAGDVDIAD